MRTLLRSAAMACILMGLASGASGQGYRVRLDSRLQSVAFRGVTADSILASAAVPAPSGGLQTPDGFAVRCIPGFPYCSYYRPGPRLSSSPMVTTGDLTVWGLGVPGLRLRGSARWGVDLSGDELWPGTEPALQLIEGYAEYAGERITGRVGRQQVTGRLGWIGFDGADLVLRAPRQGLELSAYGGWGLARGANVPINSPTLNPLEDFQLSERHLVAGAGLGWRSRIVDTRLEYRREVDPSVEFFISERVALGATFRPHQRWTLSGGAEYDLAMGLWGTSDISLRYDTPLLSADGGLRRYRPHFDLWTIWGAFSPVPYVAAQGSVSLAPMRQLRLRAGGERYWFDDSGAETALTSFEDEGWRWSFGATLLIDPRLTIDAGYRAEFGPGASSRSWEGRATYFPVSTLSLSAYGSTLTRPLEFRFDDAQVDVIGLDAEFRPSDRLRFAVSGGQFFEDRRRPDAAAFDWNQFRLEARVTYLFGSDQNRLPPAIRRTSRTAVQ